MSNSNNSDQSKIPDDILNDINCNHENIIWFDHPHPINRLREFATGAGILIFGLILSSYLLINGFIEYGMYSTVILGFGLIYSSVQIKKWKNHYYILTEESVIERHGLFRTTIDPIRYHNIKNKIKKQSFREKILSFILQTDLGNIYISTSESKYPEICFAKVQNADNVLNTISNQMDKSREQMKQSLQ
jgi:uncharacterized membrane protein YdbT with pleckstrin-like domain